MWSPIIWSKSKLIYTKGDVYVGKCIKTKHGNGRIDYLNGAIYEGY